MKKKVWDACWEISWIIMKFFFKFFLLVMWGISRLLEVIFRELNERLKDYLKLRH
jgi:hypothetical protein